MLEGPVKGPGVIRVLIADQIAHIVEQLAKLSESSDQVEVIGIARQSGDVVAEARLRHPDVLLVSSDLGDVATRSLADALLAASPGTRILVVSSTPPVNGNVPGGAVEVVSANVSGPELAAAIRRVYETRPLPPDPATDPAITPPEASVVAPIDAPVIASVEAPEVEDDPLAAEPTPAPQAIQELTPRRPRRPGRTRGEVFLVYSGKGGVGKSLVATNLAVALSMETGGRVALVDLDLQYGDAAVMLRVENHLTSIEDLAQQGETIDSEFLDEVLATGPAEVRVLLAPPSPELADLVTTANLRVILREMGKTYDYIVVDAPSHLEERTLEVIELADQILLVTGFNVTTVKSTRVTLKLFQSLGVEKNRIALVLNQTRQRVTFPRTEIEQLLHFRSLVQLPYDPHVDEAIDNGQPIIATERKSEMSRQFRALVDYLVPQPADQPAPRMGEHAPARAVSRRRFSIGRR
ncbi:MAG: P-loop NTPase [Candidatus Dormibacteraeota bacterium]|nr:P-loop NTPase [Candidatus Dormibacteraeota bacterium]